MKQLALFEQPKDGASLQSKILAFRKANRIWTFRSPGMKRDDHPWSALLMAKDETREPMAIIASECESLEQTGLLVTGEGELSAIRTLCRENKIPCPL